MSAIKKILLSTALCVLLIGLFAGFAYAEEDKTGTISGSNVNLRETPDTSSKVITQLDKGIKVTIQQTSDNWYKVTVGSNSGWVRNDFISLKATTLGTGYVTGNNLNVRTSADTSSESIAQLKEGEKVTLLEKSDNWYKIKTNDGTIGWASADFVSTKKVSVSRGNDSDVSRERDVPVEDEPATLEESNSDTVDKLIAYAKKYLGKDYVYGAESPKVGFDCSGFTQYVFEHFGLTLERTAFDQSTNGTVVKRANLRAGDLVFFDSNGGHNRVNHVGIYIGNGQFIHASSGQDEVVINDLDSEFYGKCYMKARRYIVKE